MQTDLQKKFFIINQKIMIYIFELIPIFFSGNMLQNSSKEAQYTTISVDQKD